MRLTGIIDYTMDNFLCVRGFAPMLDLADISMADKNIQRDLIEEHRGEMEAFLNNGKFTFFPEVILCANMGENENDKEKIERFREEIRAEGNVKKTQINHIKYVVKKNVLKKENNDLAFDIVQTVIMEFEKEILKEHKFIRIDGNHRLSAVCENSSYALKRIPYCLLLFRDEEETNKFCRALFYNINTKQIPLKMEQNLKVIIESDTTFDDDTLKNDPSFGWNYYLTREVIKKLDLFEYPFLKMFIEEKKYTFFVEVFKLLLDNKLVVKNEECTEQIKLSLENINGALRVAALNDVSDNLGVIGAFSYYELQDSKKAKSFLKWVQKNNLIEISNLHMDDVIGIYDKIYESLPKKVFMSMWFNERTKDTYQAVKDVKETILRDYNIDLELIKVDEHTDGYSDFICKRILEGIDNCNLLIADLSYGNKNVHHEIGYAQGKGKKVLMLYQCREGVDAAEEIGSNLSMHDQLRFKTYIELREKLLEKIKNFFFCNNNT